MAQSGLLNFLQAASNEAAGTVAGPVDILAWLARKAGVPVGDAPVGGSDLMKRQGLMVDVPQSAASLAGSTVGLLAPVAAAAKAPQIAKGLLQAGDNLAAPRTLNPQTGAVVWHGSPHKFDKFDSSKIGTGEGAQAYGHGLYLADAPGVAKTYADMAATADDAFAKAGDTIWPMLRAASPFKDDVIAWGPNQSLISKAEFLKKYEINPDAVWAKLTPKMRSAVEKTLEGNLYKVDLPDEQIAKMLDFDGPLSSQPEVLAALNASVDRLPKAVKVNVASGDRVSSRLTGAELYNRIAGNPHPLSAIGPAPTAGRPIMGAAGAPGIMEYDEMGQAAASGLLNSLGVPGIKYLDGVSRGAGSGTRNYVVFDEGLLNILERNGQAIK